MTLAGPRKTYRCPMCGHEWWAQTTAGADFASFYIKACPCPAEPEIVKLDDLDLRSAWDAEQESA